MCIKKWLRLKNVCPLCHRPVFKEDGRSSAEPNENVDPNQNAMMFDMDDLDDLDF